MAFVRNWLLVGAFCTLLTAVASAEPTAGNVTSYGAVGDGITNDSAAFNSCLASNAVCWIDPGKIYAVGNVQLKNGTRLIGLGVVEYGTSNAATAATRPVLIAIAGSANVIDTGTVSKGAAIEGVFIDCKSPSINGISGGSFQLTIQDTTVVGCANGFGGGKYSGEAHILNSTFGGNQTGIAGLVNSFVINTDLSNNSGDGIYLGSGANANTIVNTRFEWNEGSGLQSYGGTEANSISNCLFDRNSKAGLRLVGVTGMSISNSTFFRNGRNNVGPDQNAQIFLSGSRNISITGGLSAVGQDDGRKGPFTPAYVFSYDPNAASSNVTISGFLTAGLHHETTNPKGSFTIAAVEGAEPVAGYSVSGVNDIPQTSTALTGITAFASGGQAGATQLTATINTISTAKAVNASVKLSLCVPGRQQTVANLGANSIQVFGASSNTINGLATGTGIAQAAGKIATYVCTGGGNWTRLLSG